MAVDFKVSIPPHMALSELKDTVQHGSFTGEMIDQYTVLGPEGVQVIVAVFEKHFFRAGNRVTLTVTLHNAGGVTHVHSVGGGGGEGLFRFDWGAADSFAEMPREVLSRYIIE
ncbi:DUF6054 family protein [Hydrogenoanaerobacterium sp.]|uniref:DUF6054 family protein n=1 Tax=Hydrogenoanaerobacterium sp. TaxID=2953763 RepID=UPI0028971104|nr:DUF6054 family protein [Hydrogenoanaerobacterium sp.]